MAVTWETVKLATTSNSDMTQLIDIIESGFPKFRHMHELPLALQEYYQIREHLYTVDGVILYNNRIVIPLSLRQHVLTALHSAHQGMASMKARADSTVFWPGITPAIIALQETCNHCNHMAPSQPSAPPSLTVPPAYPFQCICADFFHHKGVNYLVIVDRYITAYHQWRSPTQIAGQRLVLSLSNESSLTTLPPTAALTLTPCSVPSSNIVTHLIRTQSCPPHSAFSEGPSRTSYLSCLAAFNPTLLGVTP